MSNIVFILGAGASKMAGVPLMAEFLEEAKNLYVSGAIGENSEHFSRVFRAISNLQIIHSKSQLDINNIETIFSTLETAKTLKKLPGFKPEEIDGLLDSLKIIIGETIEKKLLFPVNNNNWYPPKPYGDFADLIYRLHIHEKPRTTVSVITFNYDMACDFAFFKKGLIFDYAIDENSPVADFYLLKLHGSLNWVHCEKLNRLVPYTIKNYINTANLQFLRHTKNTTISIIPYLKRFVFEENEVIPKPVLIPPTWNKAEHHRGLVNVWSRAAKELGEAENIFIIGYSLPETDSFFKYLYALGTVGDVPLKRIWIYNPDKSGNVENRFRNMLGPGAHDRFKYFPVRFEDAIQIFNRDVFPEKYK